MMAYTIITPDEGGSFPRWAYDMATAIIAKDGSFDRTDANGDGIVDIVQNARVDITGQRTLVGSGQIAPNLLLFDWTSVSDQAGIADATLVTQGMIDWIEQEGETLDVHFIGHGRGAMVNMAVLRTMDDFASSRFRYMQMTTLDPYSRGDDGVLEANPGGQVDFADNYYQDINAAQISGMPVPGALNFNLNDQLAAWNGRGGTAGNHHEVHDWYHWTIAPERDPNSVPRSDASLTVPNEATRTAIYDGYVADLNVDGAPDDFNGGAKIGYYFSIAGGGIGKLALLDTADFTHGLFTIDVKTGELPLYLGKLNANPPDQIALHPKGELYFTQYNGQLARGQLQFDANNNPSWTRTAIGTPLGESFPYQMAFSLNGSLARGEADVLMQISPTTGQLLGVKNLDWGFATVGGITFDRNYSLLVIRNPVSQSESASIQYFDTTSLTILDGFDIPYRDIIQLTMVEGLLYGFRENGEYVTINIMTEKTVDRGPLALPAGATLRSVTSTTEFMNAQWHNRALPTDVNEDGRVNSSDVLTLVNTLLVDGARSLLVLADYYELRSYQYDVTNDGRVNTSDVLAVINQMLLGSPASTPAGAEAQVANAAAAESLAANEAAAPKQAPLDWIAFAAALADADDEDEDDAELWS